MQGIKPFIMVDTKTGKLSTIRKDGSPHVVPIWFVLNNNHDDHIYVIFTSGLNSLKARNMLRDPRVGLCVDDQILHLLDTYE